MVDLLDQTTTRKIQLQIMLSKNAMYLQKRSNALNNIQKHFVYNIRCENNNKLYIGQSIDPYKQFKQCMCRPFEKMKDDIDMKKIINLTFKMDILYSNMHKYKVDRMKTNTFNLLIIPLVQVIKTLKENLHHTKILVFEKKRYHM
jgi:predicted GIY-YIG superfamily endonuclease